MVVKEKRKHHFIPKAYLGAFCDAVGRLWIFEKDENSKIFSTSPENIAHERHYYSQPTPDGGQNNDAIEDYFSKLESEWPPLVARWSSGDAANDKLEEVFQFIANLRTRVPATRDVVEASLAAGVKIAMRNLEKAGRLPPQPPGHEDILDHMAVSIDPHQSIHAMANLIKGLGPVFDSIGLEIIYNDTGMALISSDNPVSYFDPDVAESSVLPYTVRPRSRAIELLLPVSPALMLRGHTELKVRFSMDGMLRRRTADKKEIKRYNRMAARFGYRFAFAQDRSSERLIQKYASLSPVPDFRTFPTAGGEFLLTQMVFGPRPPKPKWVKHRE